MEITEITLKTIIPKKGYLLTDGEVTTNVLFIKNTPTENEWWEIPDPNHIAEFDGTDYLCPITYIPGMEITIGLWYTDGEDIWEAIKDGIPQDFNDKNYFDIID